MTTEIRSRKIGRVTQAQQNSSNEIVERWQRFQFALNRTHPEGIAETGSSRQQATLAEGMQIVPLLIGGLVTVLLIARIGLKLIAVNPGTPLAQAIVELTNLFLLPFSGMTETFSAPHMAVVELSSLTAVILYPFAAWCLIKLLRVFYPRHA